MALDLDRVGRAEEFRQAAEFILSRNPRLGRQIGDHPLWILTTAEVSSLEPLTIYYAFKPEVRTVYLLAIRRGPPVGP